ncbi:cytochrome P450 [Rhodofomes roseus]|uniref:Cytochrome P450 n=1 Tax=Rhodofomes roseus TaxID=34475 RepID=A0ABQ8KAV0_9APHY|nr:cytochrome P450 [Rhodofomes roseus]KAH9834636.1 cytochrome P450 [Rhodofomes roseus]
MGLSLDYQVALGLAIFVGIIYYASWQRRGRRRHLPPGPRPLPILGNIHQMTLEYPEKRFAKLREKYGDIVYLKMFNTPVLIINTVHDARELLERPGKKYLNRPYSTVKLMESLGWDHISGFQPYTEEVRKHRRWMHIPFFSKRSLSVVADVQRRNAINLLGGLLRNPDDFWAHIHRYTASTMLQYVSGHTVTSADDSDEYLDIINKALEETVRSAAPGTVPVYFLPFLNYIPAWAPGGKYKRNAAWVKSIVKEAAQRTYDLAESKIGEDKEEHAVIPALIKSSAAKGTLELERHEIMMFGLAMYAGGIESSHVAVSVFILFMVLNPDVYAKAQEEIDRVTCNARLPTIDDRHALPYLECILKETYRVSSPAPLGVAHETSEDDEYRGYWIPKRTTVITNIWLMLHDAEAYPDPEVFCPDRFNGLYANQEDPRNIIFGFGRRICPGRRFADSGIWQAMANITATFDICKARDAMGNEITPPGTFTSGLVRHPHRFQCSITPRSKQAAELILDKVSEQA